MSKNILGETEYQEKRLFFFILVFLVFASGCSKGEEFKVVYSNGEVKNPPQEKGGSKPYTIPVVPKLVNIPYFNAVEEGAAEAGKDLGVKVIYKGPTVADADQQIRVINVLIDQKVDVIAISANDPDKLIPFLKKAKILLISIPPLILFIFFNKKIVAGMTAGSVK